MRKKGINPNFLPTPIGSFNRACEVKLGGYTLLSISGTASVGPRRQTMHPNNFKAQVEQAYDNIFRLLLIRGFKIEDVIKWRVYLRDIRKHYREFNLYRNDFFRKHSIKRHHFGASVCVEAKLCRKELLVEIEAEALKCH